MDKYEIKLLKKMFFKKIIGKNDKYEPAILSGFPIHEHKKYKKALDSLVSRGYVVSRPKPHGTKYGLNSRLIKEIAEIIEKAE